MRLLYPIVGVAVLAAASAAWWAFPPEPTSVLRSCQSPLARVEQAAAPELGPRIERWRLLDARGDTVRALWRPAPPEVRAPWTLVLLGGAMTGDRAALLLPADLPAHVLAVDWPWSGPRRLSAWSFAREHLAIRSAVLRAPAALALAMEALSAEPRVAPSRIALLGASLGVPPALAALALTDSPKALVLIHGAADLEGLVRHALEGRVRPGALRAFLAAYVARLVHPLEPALHLERAVRVPTLIISAGADEWLHPSGVAMLETGIPAASIVRHGGGHVLPKQRELIAEISRDVMGWLDRLDSPHVASEPRAERILADDLGPHAAGHTRN